MEFIQIMHLYNKLKTMDLQTLLTADYLDIVYYNRNKTYGGYELRKHYNRRLSKALIFLVSAIVAVSCLSFISAGRHSGESTAFSRANTITEVILPPPVPRIEPPLPPSPPPPAQHIKTRLFTDPVITDDVIPEDKRMANTKDLTHSIIGNSTADGDTANISIAPSAESKSDITGVISGNTSDQPHRFVDQPPFFNGDLDAYINAHLHYPEAARVNGIEGRVVIEFVVNENGAVTNAHIVRSIGGGCDEEALNMVKVMTGWRPGKLNGVPVKVFFSIPIKFELH